MDPADLFNAAGRAEAERRASQERANTRTPMRGGADRFGGLLNGWVMCALIIGFVLGYIAKNTIVGAFIGAAQLGLVALAILFGLRLFGFAVGAGMGGIGALNRGLGATPQWTILGALGAAGFGAGIALWLDNGVFAGMGPAALRLAPWGAALGLAARLAVLGVGALGRNRAG
jgi:hypothetical protein